VVDKSKNMEVDMTKARELRLDRVLSIEELAAKAGVSKNTVWNLESGTGRAHAQSIRKIAAALDVEPRELIKK
jgi:transcriptional regulator with XRE-family HTH domain